MNNGHDHQFEQRIRFVAKHYKEGRLDADKAWKIFASERAIRRRIPLRRYVAGIAAGMLLLVGLGTVYLVNQNMPKWVVFNTLENQIKDIYLPDSTLISLSGNSEIRYNLKDYNKKRRAVEMKGKAFFQVAQDYARPFTIKTDYTLTTVVGTSFQIDEQKESTKIHVITGRVLFEGQKGTDRNLLTSGMSAEYKIDNRTIGVFAEEAETNLLSWKTHSLVFHETPLEEVIDDLSGYYKVKIINRLSHNDLKLTATFNDLSLDETLSIINQTLDIKLVVTGGQ